MNDIKLNVSGKGQLNIGNLAQGNEVNINSGSGAMDVSGSGGALIQELLKVVREASGGNEVRVQALEGKVQELGRALATEPKNTGKIKELLGLIKEHHSWAFPAIAAIVTKVAPMVSALL
jgi:hypothetical protein